ncbi:hypothetical protein TBK1r_78100 [Stieleria magnilauensis]|uniref:Uncharacterized protein n=1 Tax=Stieleria magnilauensis TaxID=2527963 RepID=A0ABX5Y4M9_9BACT|nr:hypothetical protein TBK1r_78100 [Planctomycetes bacterium TBK1r]
MPMTRGYFIRMMGAWMSSLVQQNNVMTSLANSSIGARDAPTDSKSPNYNAVHGNKINRGETMTNE